jgi:hypothetical protein
MVASIRLSIKVFINNSLPSSKIIFIPAPKNGYNNNHIGIFINKIIIEIPRQQQFYTNWSSLKK